MIKRVLIFLFVFMLITLIGLWFLGGGVSRMMKVGSHYTNPIDLIFGSGSSTNTFIQLPWQITLPQGPDISGYTTESDTQNQSNASIESQLSDAQDQYESIRAQAKDARTFGNPSPFVGTVTMSGDVGAKETDPNSEYVEISASPGNTVPISLGGWSLQSAVTGLRMTIPPGASTFFMGVVNSSETITLTPGAHAIINSGISPVGISLRENACTGYLNQFQHFSPEITASCPTPSDSLPLDAENLRQYGDACLDYVRSMQSCTFPYNSLPSGLSFSCRSFILNTFSYNGCVQQYRSEADFARSDWRIYLASGVELWKNSHDVIRLLDAQGRTVDVMTY